MQKNKKIYRNDLQIIRGLAVSIVVLFHLSEKIFPYGYLGVDIFFVISGYVVTPLIVEIFIGKRSRTYNLKYFFIRRFYRLAPALIVILILSVILIFLFANLVEHKRFALQGIATLMLIGNIGAYKYNSDYFSPNPNPLVHTWSLSVEEQIYIVLPFVLSVFFYKFKFTLKRLYTVYLIICVLSLIVFLQPRSLIPLYSILGVNEIEVFSFYSPLNRVWEFAVGGIVYLLDYEGKKQKIFNKPIILGLILVVTILILHTTLAPILVVLSTALVIFSKTLDGLPEIIKSTFKWIGDRSYSIYLIHMPLIYIARYSPSTSLGNDSNRFWQLVIAFFFIFILGSLIYNKVENLFRNGYKENFYFHYPLRKLVALLAVPFVLFLTMYFGVSRQYWGLDKQAILVPKFAGDLNSDCLYDTELPNACVYRNLNFDKTLFLFGDSHAAQISQAVADAAKIQKWDSVVWKNTGCHILSTSQIKEDANKIKTPANCIKANLLARNWINKNKPDLIIISQYTKNTMPLDDLKRALIELKSMAPRVLLIGNGPVFSDHKTFMVSKPILHQLFSPQANFPQTMFESEMDKSNLYASNLLSDWAANNGISTMDFGNIFCKSGTCTRFLPDIGWLYRDVDHLSVEGAQLTTPQIELFLKSIKVN